MKIPGAPRVAHRVGRFVASADRRRGQLCTVATARSPLKNRGKLFKQAEPLLYDQKKEIDRLAMKMYKHNLAILNNRYGEFERRLFELLAKSGERLFVVGLGGDLLVANAVKDGLFEDKHVQGMTFDITGTSGGASFTKSFPMSFTYWVTDTGVEFLKRFATGSDIA